MKKTFSFVLPVLMFLSLQCFATIKTITVQDFSFAPANLTAFVGDTIKFQRVSGTHTTTCNGTSGSTRPAGAPAWNSPMTSGSPTFFYVITIPGAYHYICTPHAASMQGNITAEVPTGVNIISQVVPERFSLLQNYPNPFNPETNINFNIAKQGLVKLKIYNLSGKEVAELVNESLPAGSYSVGFNAAALSSGVYFYRLESDAYSEIKKMTLVK